jgi:hypothetical protein
MSKEGVMADRELFKKSGSGIRIRYAGQESIKTLEEIVAEEKTKEDVDKIKPDPVVLHPKPRVPIYPGEKGYKGSARIYSRREINQLKWKEFVMDATTIDECIATLLLGGQEMSGPEMRAELARVGKTFDKAKFTQRFSFIQHKTDFGKLVSSRREGKGRMFKLVTPALDLTPKELATFVYKHTGKGEVLEKHPALKVYFEDQEKPDPTEPQPGHKADMGDLVQGNGPLNGALEAVLSQELGVKVEVSGRVEVVFKLGD